MNFLDKTGLAYFYSKITNLFYNKNEIDSKLVQTNGLPTNTVMGFEGDTVPEGFEEVNTPIEHLANMFFPIGYTFIDTVGTIDYSNHLGFTWQKTLQGVTPVGQNTSDTDFATIGTTGGKKTITLSKANLPNYTLYSASHTHTFTGTAASHTHTFTGTAGSHSHAHDYSLIGDNGIVASAYKSGETNAYYQIGKVQQQTRTTSVTPKGSNSSTSVTPKGSNSSTTITVSSGGSGTAITNLQPYQVVVFWTRVA